MTKNPKPSAELPSSEPVARDSPFEILRRNGFIGSGCGPADLSVRVKEQVADFLVDKYGDP